MFPQKPSPVQVGHGTRAGMVNGIPRKSQTLLPERACGFESRSPALILSYRLFEDGRVHPPDMRARARELSARRATTYVVGGPLAFDLPYHDRVALVLSTAPKRAVVGTGETLFPLPPRRSTG